MRATWGRCSRRSLASQQRLSSLGRLIDRQRCPRLTPKEGLWASDAGRVLGPCFGSRQPEPKRFGSATGLSQRLVGGPSAVMLDMFFIGCRVCVRGKPRTCGRVVRLMPMTSRVLVRVDPPHPKWRGALRSFRLEQLVVCENGNSSVGCVGVKSSEPALGLNRWEKTTSEPRVSGNRRGCVSVVSKGNLF